jgi:parvulin-like peptidyl-prolyl isomerase
MLYYRANLFSVRFLKGVAINLHILRGFSRLLPAVAAGLLLVFLGTGCGSRPAAIVNSTKISEADLNKRLREEAGAKVLTNMIEAQIIRDAFAAAKLTMTDQDVSEYVTDTFGTMDRFQQQTQAQGIDATEYTELVIKPTIMLMKLATKDLVVNDEVLKKFYAANKTRFDQPEMVTFRLITCPTKEAADKAMEALKGGADFAKVVTQYSIQPDTRATGGLAPPAPLAALPPEFKVALSGLKEGQMSDVRSLGQSLGWGILKLEKRTPAQNFTYDQVKTKVEKAYRSSQITSARMQALQQQLRREAKVTVVASDLQALNEEFRTQEVPEFGGEATGTTGAAPAAPATGAATSAAPAAPAATGAAPTQP